ncbi:Aspartyl protease family A01B [Phytophthora palmivora]|uniref:Aspartyl protease family A01B n=1 Tax=Phytophthora palmivora TaxID=4796 RepID=A0A2P4X275_9STRA|nr:Aspartyl protease family A01B [Phytophthora palmivora]
MVRVIAGFPTVLLAVSTLSALADQEVGMTMQLHRLPKHNIHPERYTRRLNSEEDAPELVPLHLGLGTHYTWVYAGTPPQRASVIADTGSGLMAFPCSGCDGCGKHTDEYFQADNSSTLVHVTCSQKSFFQCKECKVTSDTCSISQSYMEGSTWKASVVEDVVYLGGESSFENEEMRNQYGTHFQFGCQSSETGLFVTQVADGIMGLSNTENHIVAKLHRENKIPSNLFSLCFTENGGTMSVGQPHKTAHRGEISYAKVIADRSAGHFYNVHMKDIRIGGKSINAKEEAFTRGHYIVDSGTTDSYLPRLLKTEFLQAFKAVSGRDYQVGNACKGFTNEDLASLPTIQLVMEAYGDENAEVTLDVPPEQYLIDTNGAYCGGIYLSENSGGVIGANLMLNRDVIFDNGNQRVGFVDADCAFEGAANATAAPSIHKGATTESEVPTATNAAVPSATSAVAKTAAPIAVATLAPAATVAPTPEPTTTTVSTLPATSPVKKASAPISTTATVEPSATPALKSAATVTATVEPSATPALKSAATVTATTNTSTLGAGSTNDQNIQPLSDETTTTTQSSSSAATGDSKMKEKSSGAHPMVLTIVGAVLVVGFLLMMLISVSRRRQKDGKEQLWSRVKGDEEDEDDDDEEDFGLVRNDKQKAVTTKHQRLDQDDDDDNDSSSDEEDEVFDRQSVQESKVDNRTLERL